MAEDSQFSEEQLMELQRQIEALRRDLNAGLGNGNSSPEPEEEEAPEEGLNGSRLTIAEDFMSAYLILNPPAPGKAYETGDILEFLRGHGVVSGYHSSNISAMVKKNIYYKEVKVAVGCEVTPGQDGYFEYFFDPDQLKEPSIRADGSVDYSSMGMLQNVGKGDIVAVYHRAVQGAPGQTVTGEERKCNLARELPPMRGRNISRLEDGITYVSEVDGKVEVKDGRVDVQNIHEIHGDVTYVDGKVEFYGDIMIYGGVASGVIIRAGRNVVIKGITEAVTIYAGGDIIMEKGLVGGQKAKISARGNVFADFVENATIEAKGSVNANIILNSNVSASGSVLLTGKKGALIGGSIHGLTGITAVSIGNEAEVKTIVHAGCDNKTYMKLMSLHRKEQETAQVLEETVAEMAQILKRRHQGGRVNQAQEQKLSQLNARKDECFALLDDLKKDRALLEETSQKGKGAQIVCGGPIYRGVILSIDNARLPIERNTCYMKYRNNNGFIDGEVVVVN